MSDFCALWTCACADCRAEAVIAWREERLGAATPADRAWRPWRDGEGFLCDTRALPPSGSSTWRRGIWTGGRQIAAWRTG